ncbi:hypothetical protein [Methylomagnum sp.]
MKKATTHTMYMHLIEPQPKVKIPAPRPKTLTAWLAELPLTNSRRCFNAIDAVLEAFNADAKIPAATRLELAELLRPMVCLLAERAESHFMDAPLPYPPQAEYYAGLALRLHERLGRAYALAGLDPNYKPGWFEKSERHLTRSLYRALQHWGLVLLRTAQQYRTPTADYWAMLYDLYRNTEIRQLLLARFDDPEEPESCQTPLGVFKRTLLFALTSTRHLRQRDMWHVYDLLGTLVDQAVLSAENEREGEPAEFFVRLNEARPPFCSHPEDGEDKAKRRFLFTGDLTRELSKQALLQTAEIGSEISAKDKRAIDRAALLRMAKNLEGSHKRKGERKAQDETCRCVLGLGRFMSALLPASTASKASARPSSSFNPDLVDRLITDNLDFAPEDRRALLPQGMHLEPEFGDRNIRSEMMASKFFAKRSLTREDIWQTEPTATPPAEAENAVVEARIANASQHGYCLAWPSDQVAGVRIGELIGVLDEQAASSISIGVIRWLHCADGQVMLGVEQLTTAAEPVDILDPAMKPAAKGLLMPPEPGLRTVPELLALPGKAQIGTMVFVRGGDPHGKFYRAHRLHENTASFSRFGLVAG